LPPQTSSIEYSLKVSTRAQHVRLRVNPYRGLEITIPKRFPKKQIPSILQQHETWITRQLQKLQHNLQQAELPTSIELSCIDQTFSIRYQHASKTRLMESSHQLVIRHDSELQAIKRLRQWVRDQARDMLTPQLEKIADEFGFTFEKAIFRSQKSRWGSCSSSGTISLNDQLVFMPQAAVRYLMIHELCHTRHMNHSRQFWQLVNRCCPQYEKYEQFLNHGRDRVPGWFLKSLYQ